MLHAIQSPCQHVMPVAVDVQERFHGDVFLRVAVDVVVDVVVVVVDLLEWFVNLNIAVLLVVVIRRIAVIVLVDVGDLVVVEVVVVDAVVVNVVVVVVVVAVVVCVVVVEAVVASSVSDEP